MIKYYLAAYNLVAFLFWGAYMISYIDAHFVLTDTNVLLLNIAQGMAILEIVHAGLRWVKSPVGSTAAQVLSRLLVLVYINYAVRTNISGNDFFNAGVVIVSLAWSITELVRYSFYFFSLFDKQPPVLLWMRYSFFIILYPLGVTGEWLILIWPSSLIIMMGSGLLRNGYIVFIVLVAISYIYYFPVLYKYMWKQRTARL